MGATVLDAVLIVHGKAAGLAEEAVKSECSMVHEQPTSGNFSAIASHSTR
jgi:hypothetical protein